MVEGIYDILLSLAIYELIHVGFMAGDEKADVGYWTGILGRFVHCLIAAKLIYYSIHVFPHTISYFFTLGKPYINSYLTYVTTYYQATVADRHGKRAVLFVSLLGSALTCFAFGTSTSLPEALAIRLLQGIFAGSIGVARSSVATITDGSNEGRAYAILG